MVSALIGAAIGGVASAYGAHSANKQSASNVDKQMEFQKEMSNTAHQREVKDLQAAGLNPMLSTKLGGATTPTGGAAPVENVGAAAVHGASSAAQQVQAAQMNQAQINLVNSQAEAASAVAAKTKAEIPREGQVQSELDAKIASLQSSARLADAQLAKVDAEVDNIVQQTRNAYATNENIQADTGLKHEQAQNVRAERGLIPARLQTLIVGIQKAWADIDNTNVDTQQKAATKDLVVAKTLQQFSTNQIEMIKVDTERLKNIETRMGLPKKNTEGEYYNSKPGQVMDSVRRVLGSFVPFLDH